MTVGWRYVEPLLPLLDDDVAREGGEVEDRTAVPVDAADGALPAAAIVTPDASSQRKIGADRATKRIGVQLEARVAVHDDAHVARVRAQIVAAAGRKGSGKLHIPADSLKLDAPAVDVLERKVAA